ncbi:probable cyclin-dependent serine/threonine-protein kinase DDB_G0292550 [Cydia splendana]|uniref:probable cyclin-dependent serine/threonine-protein kinase DDB_G0292550 n=1 Tax=Cydia splendana TaxID=1100963 RepID=UPI00300C0B66
MDFDKYVHHISQKYRLAVAILVIKTKPENLSNEEYLIQLQNKIRDMETDPNETVCSEDFNFDDDDIWNEKQHDTQMHCTETDIVNENRVDCSVVGNDSQGSQTILNDSVFNNDCYPQRDNSLGDTIRLLREVSTVQAQVFNLPTHLLKQFQPDVDQMSQLTFCDSQINPKNTVTNCCNKLNEIQNNYEHPKNIENDKMDSQETQLYTLYGFTQDYSHVSQTQDEYFIISDKYIRNNANGAQYNVMEVNEQNRDVQRVNNSQNVLSENTMHDKERESIENTINQNQTAVNVEKDLRDSQIQYNYLNDTEITQNTGAVSKCDDNVTNSVVKYIENENIRNTTTFQNDIANALDTNKHSINKTLNNNKYGNMTETNVTNTVKETNDSSTFCSHNTVTNEFTNNSDKNQNLKQDSQCNSDINKERTENNNTDDMEHGIDENIEIAMDVDESESDENVQERVPFKVIEELNRVKTFLNRKDKKYDGYSTDSGYRSDSQQRSSLRSSSQPSGGWLNQSAFCLFNHIMQAIPTDDIVKEISQVLGKLIDKLHEDENYPPFLEELLETVDGMLRDIHTDGCTDNLHNWPRQAREETDRRDLAACRVLAAQLTRESRDKLAISTATTSFDIDITLTFKRPPSLVGIDPAYEVGGPGFESWCSEILNKIIVECMNGYSLVAYAALQCFNLIQD